MGMFDYLRCHYPLPVDGANALIFQTKDTPRQFLDDYEIRDDGSLWHKVYETEDRSDPKAEGLAALCGAATRVNERWVPEQYTGAINFYASLDDDRWLDFCALFDSGQLRGIVVVRP